MIRHPFTLLLIGMMLLIVVITPGDAGDKKTKDAKAPKDPALVLEEKGEWKKEDKTYTVKLEAGKIYRIELKTDKFDAYLKLDYAGKTIATDDDSARIYHKALNTGDYSIVVNSKDRRAGPFTLTVTLAKDRTIASEYPDKTIELKWTDGKAHYKGSLNVSDGNALGRYYKVFAVKLETGKRYQIDHRSGDFDAYLILEDADGKRLQHNDDGGEGVNARLTFAPDKTGTYRIIATSLPTRKTGSFLLDIASVESKKKAK